MLFVVVVLVLVVVVVKVCYKMCIVFLSVCGNGLLLVGLLLVVSCY